MRIQFSPSITSMHRLPQPQRQAITRFGHDDHGHVCHLDHTHDLPSLGPLGRMFSKHFHYDYRNPHKNWFKRTVLFVPELILAWVDALLVDLGKLGKWILGLFRENSKDRHDHSHHQHA